MHSCCYQIHFKFLNSNFKTFAKLKPSGKRENFLEPLVPHDYWFLIKLQDFSFDSTFFEFLSLHNARVSHEKFPKLRR